jgi:hypothetical protein
MTRCEQVWLGVGNNRFELKCAAVEKLRDKVDTFLPIRLEGAGYRGGRSVGRSVLAPITY